MPDETLTKASVFGLGVLLGWVPARSLYRRFLVPFDRARFAPLPASGPFDPLRPATAPGEARALPWIAPAEEARLTIWQTLERFVDADRVGLDYVLVLGRPGAGKSRLAAELVRAVGARGALTGGTRARRLRVALGTWWRVQVRRRALQAHDPWDVGWLQSASAVRSDALRLAPPTGREIDTTRRR